MIQYSQSPQDQFKSEDYTIGWSWQLFIFSIIVFATSALIYAGMTFGYLPTLNSQIDDIKKKTDALNNSVSAADREKFFNFYSQVFHIQNALQNHLLSSHLFVFLEQNTNKNVFFDSLTFNQDTALLELGGAAVSYDDLVGQLEAFRRKSEVTSVILGSSKDEGSAANVAGSQTAATGKKGVSFTIKLAFDKQFLKQP